MKRCGGVLEHRTEKPAHKPRGQKDDGVGMLCEHGLQMQRRSVEILWAVDGRDNPRECIQEVDRMLRSDVTLNKERLRSLDRHMTHVIDALPW